SALLGEAGHVEHRAPFPFEMRRHAEQRPDRHNPGPANAGDQDAVGLMERVIPRVQQRCEPTLAAIASSALFELAAMHGYKARAEPFDAGKILVAARLI